MILLISTCRYNFHEYEFVKPISRVVEKCNVSYDIMRYNEEIRLNKYSGVIICGTALKDFDYLNYVDNFKWIVDYKGGVLGISSGYQILAKIYGNQLEEIEKIGLYKIRVLRKNILAEKQEFYAYFLHKYALRNVNRKLIPLAKQNDEICMFKVRNKKVYGVSFHPEVLNEEIIIKFLRNI